MLTRRRLIAALAALSFAAPAGAQTPDKVKVGVFPVGSALPYFVARDLGYFKELNIEPEAIVLMGGPPNVAALITGQIEVAVVLVTLEGLNADLKKPGAAMYVAMNGQNATHRMEQFVVRAGLADKVKSLVDFKGPGADISLRPLKSTNDFTLSARPARTTNCSIRCVAFWPFMATYMAAPGFLRSALQSFERYQHDGDLGVWPVISAATFGGPPMA